jgi:PD-(D/E)XK nuclease superfamily
MHEDEISSVIIGCAIDIHKTFGPGLLESAYSCKGKANANNL